MCSFKVSAPLVYRRYDLEASCAFSNTQIWGYYLGLTIRASRTTAWPELSLRASIELTCGSRNFIFFAHNYLETFYFWFFALSKKCPKSEEKQGFGDRLGWRCPSLECVLSNWPSHFFTWFRPWPHALQTSSPSCRTTNISNLKAAPRGCVFHAAHCVPSQCTKTRFR